MHRGILLQRVLGFYNFNQAQRQTFDLRDKAINCLVHTPGAFSAEFRLTNLQLFRISEVRHPERPVQIIDPRPFTPKRFAGFLERSNQEVQEYRKLWENRRGTQGFETNSFWNLCVMSNYTSQPVAAEMCEAQLGGQPLPILQLCLLTIRTRQR